MSFVPEYCEFCLTELGMVNEKKFNGAKHKEVMLKHKPNCPRWNENAARVMKIAET